VGHIKCQRGPHLARGPQVPQPWFTSIEFSPFEEGCRHSGGYGKILPNYFDHETCIVGTRQSLLLHRVLKAHLWLLVSATNKWLHRGGFFLPEKANWKWCVYFGFTFDVITTACWSVESFFNRFLKFVIKS